MARRRSYRDDRNYDDRYYDNRGYSNGGGRRRGGYSYRNRRSRRSSEREVEVITFGLILVLFLAQIVTALSTVLILVLGGFVLLGSAFYQSSRRWRVNPMTWIGGATMMIFGILGFQGQPVPLGPLLPLLVFAAVIIASFMTGEF